MIAELNPENNCKTTSESQEVSECEAASECEEKSENDSEHDLDSFYPNKFNIKPKKVN